MSEPQEVADILDGLTTPTADEVYQAVREYDTRHVVAAVGAKADGAGGGGSQPELPLDLGPGLFEIDAKGRTVATTSADADNEGALVLSIEAGPNALANAAEVFEVKDETGQQRFGVDAEGGATFNTSTLPFSAKFAVTTDALDPGETYTKVLEVGTGGVVLHALSGLPVKIVDALGDPIIETQSDGSISMPMLPTSNPGAGKLWNDAGTVKVGT